MTEKDIRTVRDLVEVVTKGDLPDPQALREAAWRLAVTFHDIPNNNHGCCGREAMVLPVTESVGVVVGGRCCTHRIHGYVQPGELPIPMDCIVRIPEGMTWESASAASETFVQNDISNASTSVAWPEAVGEGVIA